MYPHLYTVCTLYSNHFRIGKNIYEDFDDQNFNNKNVFPLVKEIWGHTVDDFVSTKYLLFIGGLCSTL